MARLVDDPDRLTDHRGVLLLRVVLLKSADYARVCHSCGIGIAWGYACDICNPPDTGHPSALVADQLDLQPVKVALDERTGGLHPAEVCGQDCSGCCDEWEWK